jgi:hypothetical protein
MRLQTIPEPLYELVYQILRMKAQKAGSVQSIITGGSICDGTTAIKEPVSVAALASIRRSISLSAMSTRTALLIGGGRISTFSPLSAMPKGTLANRTLT